MAAFQVAITSGLSGSPAATQLRRLGKVHRRRSSSTTARKIVGAPHMLVIGYCARMSSTRLPLNAPVGLWTTCAAPAMNGEKNELHAAFAQPVSEMFQ